MSVHCRCTPCRVRVWASRFLTRRFMPGGPDRQVSLCTDVSPFLPRLSPALGHVQACLIPGRRPLLQATLPRDQDPCCLSPREKRTTWGFPHFPRLCHRVFLPLTSLLPLAFPGWVEMVLRQPWNNVVCSCGISSCLDLLSGG